MLLEVKNLTIQTKITKQKIVIDSSFCLEKGKSLGIIGESGSGKTITSKALMGLLNPCVFDINGRIEFDEQNLLTLRKKDRRLLCGSSIAMIMQNPMTAFAPMIKIGKQIIDTLRIHKKQSKKDLYALSIEALKIVNLTNTQNLMNSYPHELSGGMLQRIMIALTMLLNPKLIIADEATTAVDVISERLIVAELVKLKKKGISMIIVTHDFGIANSLCDDIIVMKNGEIVESGITAEVFCCPKHSYTKELVSASNLFGGLSC